MRWSWFSISALPAGAKNCSSASQKVKLEVLSAEMVGKLGHGFEINV